MKARQMALGGLLTALGIVILYLTLLIPTNTLTLLTLASFVICVALLTTNLRTAFIIYITTSLLTIFFLPINLSILYICFFGCYGLIKARIECLDRRVLESVLKLVFFNTVLLITFNILQLVLGPHLLDPLKAIALKVFPTFEGGYLVIFILVAQVGFTVFDYALTLLIEMYYNFKLPR